jgi:PLP dependent protein
MLADERGLAWLSMGTSQDYRVAVAEGANIVRIGTRLYD